MMTKNEMIRMRRFGPRASSNDRKICVPISARSCPISGQLHLWRPLAFWILLLLAGITVRTHAAPALPVITIQPQTQIAAAGATATFSVTVAEGEAVTYEWWNEAGPLYPPQTTASLNLTQLQASHAGSYKVQVRNSAGTVTSSAAALVVNSSVAENFLIARKQAGTGIDPGANADLDSAGNVYVTGAFTGTATFGSFTLTNAGGSDIFLAKMDRTGNVAWARRAGGAGNDAGAGVAVDRAGNVHLTGTFQESAGFGGFSLAGGGAGSGFVAVLDRDGNTLWTRKVGGTGMTRATRLACDAAGNTVLLGSFTGTVSSTGGLSVTSAGESDVLLAKFSASGVSLWTKRFGGAGSDQGTGLALDPTGNIFVTGTFQDTASFGTLRLGGDWISQTFLVKCDRAGNVIWVNKISNIDSEAGTTVVAENDGSCDLTGTFSATTTIGSTTLTNREPGDPFVAKYDGQGHALWAARAGGVDSHLGLQTGDLAVTTGFASGSLDWNGGAGGVDLIVVKYSEPGVVAWARRTGASQASFSLGLMTDGAGNRYLTGFFEPADGIPDASVALLAQLSLSRAAGPPPPLIASMPQPKTVSAGNSVTLGVAATGASALNYRWRFNGVEIAGATNASYTVNRVRPTDAGSYSVIAFNADGSAASIEALLTVPLPPPTNALVLAGGVYHGLFYEMGGIEHPSSGAFSLMTAPGGRFSAVLTPGGARFAISGRFDANGHASKIVTRAGTNLLTVVLDLANSNNVDQVVGSVSGDGWTAPLWAGRDAAIAAVAGAAPVTWAGRYTLALPGQDDSTASPGGSGFGWATVDARGRLSLIATLGDGTRFSQAVPLSTQGLWPLFGRLYGGKGSVLGWIAFADRPSDDFLGLLSWISPEQLKRHFYPAGYEINRPIIGSRYVRPVSNTNRVIALEAGLLQFAGGNLPAEFLNDVRLSTNNKVTNLGSNNLSLNLALPNGQFSGRVADPVSGKAISFKGAVLQKRSAGFGLFSGTNQTGRVSWSP